MSLHRYWLTFDANSNPDRVGLGRGCGVTARDLDDAFALVRHMLGEQDMPPVVDVVTDVDVSTLDPGHVLPNMNPPSERGVWFPMTAYH